MIDHHRYESLLDAFAGARVLVLGDVMLDEYVIGVPTRISREAPVLILEQRRRFIRPGGGANPAVNLSALGARPRLVGVVGDDSEGEELRGALRELTIDPGDLVIAPGEPTTRKTRILAETDSAYDHQVVRLDRLAHPPGETVQAAIGRAIDSISNEVDALLLSDYKGGAISAATIASALRAARSRGQFVSVDSQGDLDRFHGFDLVKCNRPDAEAYVGHVLPSLEAQIEASQSLVQDLELGCLMLTLGGEGIAVTTRSGSNLVPAINRTEVFDVTGAGDTVVAVATLAMARGASGQEAAFLANLAAGQVVRRLGVVTVTVDELRGLLAEL